MDTAWLYEKPIAHRGLHGEGVAENSMTSYKKAIEAGYNIEIDVHLTKDGDFVVFHDHNLMRVCGVKGKVEKMNSADLTKLHLSGTEDTIPTLKEFLDFVNGRVGVLIEIKTLFSKTIGKKLYEYMENLGYKGNFAIQSFGPYCLKWYRNHTTGIPVGQLGCDKSKILHRFTSLKPDFIAYNVAEMTEQKAKKFYKKAPRLLLWTVRTDKEKDFARKNADNMIFELTNPYD